jgi:phenylacetate-coenzyme A ligase PaaK-like adenylate-forming protein
VQNYLNLSPFELDKRAKTAKLTPRLLELTRHHIASCPEYAKMMRGIGFDGGKVGSYYDIPFLPTRLFKELDLKSVQEKDVFKRMTSSGTAGQAVSNVCLDRQTASNQQKVLVGIVSDFIGPSRLPMLIIDSPAVVKDRALLAARGAGIIGLSIFGTDKTYALNDDMSINIHSVKAFRERHLGRRVLLFGFTYMIWKHFIPELEKPGMNVSFPNSVLLHVGGWKKLISESVSKSEYRNRITRVTEIASIHDYYGMAEQLGSIYMECEYGHLHSSVFSDVITRRASDFSVCDFGEKGIVQVVSVLPESYPGHSLLTEDEGAVLGEDDCPCGRKGKYFDIRGRLPDAEIRGCSDTYAAKFN